MSEPITVWKATKPGSGSCYFGNSAFAAGWAGPRGKVEAICLGAPPPEPPFADVAPLTVVRDLATIVAKLTRALRKADPQSRLPDQATDYLKRHGLGSPLRLEKGYLLHPTEVSGTREERSIVTPTLKYFAYAHLPQHLQAVSRPIGELAELLEAEGRAEQMAAAGRCWRRLLVIRLPQSRTLDRPADTPAMTCVMAPAK